MQETSTFGAQTETAILFSIKIDEERRKMIVVMKVSWEYSVILIVNHSLKSKDFY